MTYRLEKLH
ncbi:Protein of unknown function [Bacillus cereus]|nr:Protein of unknown function [Bacillus cereus]